MKPRHSSRNPEKKSPATTFVDPLSSIQEYLDRSDWRVNANANQGYSLGGMILNVAGKVTANYWLDCLLSPEIGRAHREGDLHIHDLDMLAGYCAGWSLRQLLRKAPRWPTQGLEVFVCENPNLVAIAADALGEACAPLVCTDGMPAAAQRALLSQLAAAGARLRYHGDFDWPGIAIANLMQREFGATAWRMSALDYEAALETHAEVAAPLAGAPVAPQWCEALGAAMRRLGKALAEETVATTLLQDLVQP